MADNASPRRAPKAAAADTVTMLHEDGNGCSWRGQSFAADANGVVTVPIAAAAELLDHGFSFVGR
ncbi:hypothetical protein [Sphingomonas asaccharolytica]|uniref:hypothetical protein n=1 Tax=Sphingomonas asaccharolytica TaxID=40681 RepID=UPI00083331EB|nr:hypothetical protein [Sphingomonas asaccharolytica]